jgi:hypothetical protein
MLIQVEVQRWLAIVIDLSSTFVNRYVICLPLLYFILSYARPALPTWIISPVSLSSLRSTGQLVPSALTKVISSFVPRILNLLSSGLMPANSGNLVL